MLFERTDTKEVRFILTRKYSIFAHFIICIPTVFAFSFLQICLQHGRNRRDLERMDYSASRHPEFRYKTEFQSHEPEVLTWYLFIFYCFFLSSSAPSHHTIIIWALFSNFLVSHQPSSYKSFPFFLSSHFLNEKIE